MRMFSTRSLSLSLKASLLIPVFVGCNERASAPRQKPVPVRTVSVVQQEIQRTTSQPATVSPFYRAEMRARASGYVKEVKADIGDFVKAGAIMAVIDLPDMASQREIIEARITLRESQEALAEAGVELAQAQVRSAEAKLAQSQSELGAVDARLVAVEAEFARTRDLVERQSLESRILDEVRGKRDAELANKQAMVSAVRSAEADVSVAKSQATSAQAHLQAARAETTITRRQLDELDVLMDYAILKAPFDGIVTHRSIDPGDLVREESEVGSGEPLFVVSQVATVRVQIPVPEAEAALVSRGDSVTLSFPSFPAEQPITAAVTRVSGDLDPSTRTMLVEVHVPNDDRKLIPGMFGQAEISLGTRATASMLPARAIRFAESGEAYVYIVADDQTVTVVPVTTGIDTGNSIEVTSGLEPGQQVIDAHLKRFANGQKVALVSNQAP
jgi:RND family efflux transporter MFP subunit